MDIRSLSCEISLRDGSVATLRAIRPDDKQRLLDGFHRLTGKSIYFRFHTSKKNLSETELHYFTEIDFEHHVALVISVTRGDEEQLIGVGRFVQVDAELHASMAEIAIAVDDAHQGLGVGTILFEQLVLIAQHRGIQRLAADVLLENTNMLDIFKRSGFKLETVARMGVAHIEFDLDGVLFKRYYENSQLPF